MNQTKPKGVILLLITAFIWGLSFVAQSVGSEKVEAFTYNGIRTLLGALFLAAFILVKELISKGNLKSLVDKKLLKNGLILGIVFAIASNLQQFAFYYSSAGKIAFITALYIFFVPLIGIIFRRKFHPAIWLCVIAGIIGLYLLSVKDGDFNAINRGDIYALACAFFFAIHIMLIDKVSPESDGIKLSCAQFTVAGIITIILMFIFEKPQIDAISSATLPLLYSGLLSCGVAYTLQIIGQKYTNPVLASLLMCLESVFAVISAAILLKEIPTTREGIGCLVMFAAIIASQIIEFKTKKRIT